MSDLLTAPSKLALRCPWCAGTLRFEYVFDGRGYSDHRSVESVECDSCDSSWSADGEPLYRPRWERFPDLYEQPENLACAATMSYTYADDGVWLNYECGHAVNLGFGAGPGDVAAADADHRDRLHIAHETLPEHG